MFLVDPKKPQELRDAKRLNAIMIRRAQEAGGTCTGEHGVGVGKRVSVLRTRLQGGCLSNAHAACLGRATCGVSWVLLTLE